MPTKVGGGGNNTKKGKKKEKVSLDHQIELPGCVVLRTPSMERKGKDRIDGGKGGKGRKEDGRGGEV